MSDKNILDQRIRLLQRRKWIRSLLFSLAATAGVVYLLLGVLFGISIVRGDSMVPGLRSGDLIFYRRFGSSEYRMGDIVLIRTGEKSYYIKRVCAVPGETVDIDDGAGGLLINGEPATEPYIYSQTFRKEDVVYPLTLGEGEYFCMGDNRGNSLDSRNYGPVDSNEIEGKALTVFRIF